MSLELKHATVATIAASGEHEVDTPQWNENHVLSMASARLVGRTTAAAGVAEEISVGTGLSLGGLSLSFDLAWGDARYLTNLTAANVHLPGDNLAIGFQAGSTLTSGTNNVVIGYGAQPSAPTANDEITLGGTWNSALRIPGMGLLVTEDGLSAWGFDSANWDAAYVATQAAVAASATDTTAGRLLKVGDFGWGGLTTGGGGLQLTDSQGIDITGAYRLPSTAANLPVAGQNYNLLNIASSAATNTTIAITWSNSSTGPRVFFRGQSAAYSSWVEAFHNRNILGAVSQAAGVPTGAVMEYGSNANGEYWKYAGGMMICSFSRTPVSIGANTFSSYTWTFPSAFSTAPMVSASPTQNFSASSVPASASVEGGVQLTNTGTRVSTHNLATTSQTIGTTLLALGRWF